MEFPEDLKYTKEHEWVRVEGNRAIVGITEYAQGELGDVVYVELPEVDTEVEQNATFGQVESVKAVSDLYAPVSGTIVEVNESLDDEPELINSDPYEEGWMIVLDMSEPLEIEDLLTAEDYQAHISQEAG